jgi:hypothetical protein
VEHLCAKCDAYAANWAPVSEQALGGQQGPGPLSGQEGLSGCRRRQSACAAKRPPRPRSLLPAIDSQKKPRTDRCFMPSGQKGA